MPRSPLLPVLVALGLLPALCQGAVLLVPMDGAQADHLRAYGLTSWCLQAPRNHPCEWLLNYRGGSFIVPDDPAVRQRAAELGVTTQPLSDAARSAIAAQMQRTNAERISLVRAPRIAVYVPPDAEPWDDAVRLAMDYAQIKYDTLWDREVLGGKLADYDWLHLHHEDFTGQFGRYFVSFANEPWYRQAVLSSRNTAHELGYQDVPHLKHAVARELARWVAGGGFLFAMCCAPDTLDIALASQNVDIVPPELDGTPADPDPDRKLDFSTTLAFRGFHLQRNPYLTQLSDIDVPPTTESLTSPGDTFDLFEFSARQDPVATMLVQCHVNAVPDFLGQTTAFRKSRIRPSAIILGEFGDGARAKYIHGDYGKGAYTFLAGHDPEDYAHVIGEPATDLSRHRNSPGYRLILNNVLFPAAKTRQRKT